MKLVPIIKIVRQRVKLSEVAWVDVGNPLFIKKFKVMALSSSQYVAYRNTG